MRKYQRSLCPTDRCWLDERANTKRTESSSRSTQNDGFFEIVSSMYPRRVRCELEASLALVLTLPVHPSRLSGRRLVCRLVVDDGVGVTEATRCSSVFPLSFHLRTLLPPSRARVPLCRRACACSSHAGLTFLVASRRSCAPVSTRASTCE